MITLGMWARACEATRARVDVHAFTAEHEPFTPGDTVEDFSGGFWRVVGIDVCSGLYLLQPAKTLKHGGYSGPANGFSPFTLARAKWRGGPTWEADRWKLSGALRQIR
jgi:hypothetical protein